MKIIKGITPKGVHVPIAALKLSHLESAEQLELHALDNTLILLNRRMTAPELLSAAQRLSDMAAELLTHLAGVCGPCEDCGGEDCPCDSLEDAPIDLPDYLRQAAGIPQEAKLRAEVNEESSSVTLSAAEHRYDLRDLPSELVDTFVEAGTCLRELEKHMILEDIVYGR